MLTSLSKKTITFKLLNGLVLRIKRFSIAESLLLNIQGLLKVAAENTRQHERQAVYEKSKFNNDGHTKHSDNVSRVSITEINCIPKWLPLILIFFCLHSNYPPSCLVQDKLFF